MDFDARENKDIFLSILLSIKRRSSSSICSKLMSLLKSSFIVFKFDFLQIATFKQILSS